MTKITLVRKTSVKEGFDWFGPEMVLVYFWILTIFIQAVSGFVFMIGAPSVVITLFIYSIMALLLLLNINKLLKISICEIAIAIFMLLSFMITMLFWPQNIEYMVNSIGVFANCVLFFFSGRIYKYCENAENLLYKASIIALCLAYFAYFTSLAQTEKGMTFAYATLPSVVVIINYCVKYRRKLSVLAVVAGIVLLFLLGTRGPLLFSVIYLGYSLFKYIKGKFARLALVLAIALILWIVINDIYIKWVEDLYKWLLTKNIDSYILKQIVTENSASLDERSNLSALLKESINKNWLFGIGIFGDSILLGVYVHNIFLEILSGYGIIFGSMLMIAMVVSLLYLFKRADKNDKEFIIILLFSYLLKLFVSSSFLIDTGFWFMVGILCGIFGKSKDNTNI